jgi:hypothetical protein
MVVEAHFWGVLRAHSFASVMRKGMERKRPLVLRYVDRSEVAH